jgi:hypothetical protein
MLIGDGVSIAAREVQGLHGTYHRLGNHFGRTRWYSEVMWFKWKLISVHLEVMLILTQDSYTVCANVPLARKLFWRHPMELLGDMGRVKSCFGRIGDGVSIAAREVHDLHGTYHRLGNHFGRTRWYS